MKRPHGFASYQNFYVEIWQDERESWWAFLYLQPAGARRTHHPTGGAMPVLGGPWASRDDVIEAAKDACDMARAAAAPHASPRCRATRPRRLGQKVGAAPERAR